MSKFKIYKSKDKFEMREITQEDLDMYNKLGVLFFQDIPDPFNAKLISVSIARKDKIECNSPKMGDMIARDINNHNEQWLVPEEYFMSNYMQSDNSDQCASSEFGTGCENIRQVTADDIKKIKITDGHVKEVVWGTPAEQNITEPKKFTREINLNSDFWVTDEMVDRIINRIEEKKLKAKQLSNIVSAATVQTELNKREKDDPSGPAFLYNPNNKVSFGEAIAACKKGSRILRTGWNGSGMFVYHVSAAEYPAMSDVAKKYFGSNGLVPYREYLALKTAQGDVATWAPSGSDALAEDWIIVD